MGKSLYTLCEGMAQVWSGLCMSAGQATKPTGTSVEEGLCARVQCLAFVVRAMEGRVRSINEKRQVCDLWGWTVSEETLALAR